MTQQGFEVIGGVGKESAWGTGVAVTERLPLVGGLAIKSPFDLLTDEVLEGEAAPRTPDQGAKRISGKIPTKMRYRNVYLMLENFFGAYVSGGAPLTYTYTMNKSIEGKSVTAAFEKGVSIWEYIGLKIRGFELKADPKGIFIDYDAIIKDLLRAGTTNDTAALAALTDTDANVLFDEMNFRIGDLADALAVGDEIKPSSLSIKVERKLEPKYAGGSKLTLEPLEEDKRLGGKLSFTLPRYASNTLKDWADANTKLQARVYFDNSANNLEFLLPEITVDDFDLPVSGPGSLPISITCSLGRNDNNSNMTVTEEIELNSQ